MDSPIGNSLKKKKRDYQAKKEDSVNCSAIQADQEINKMVTATFLERAVNDTIGVDST
jgi:hypothetical protein